MVNLDVRDNLKAYITEQGYIQHVIARKANLSPSKFSAILNKSRKLDVNEMLAICDVLKIEPEKLINFKHVS